jgi:hypothetical protein
MNWMKGSQLLKEGKIINKQAKRTQERSTIFSYVYKLDKQRRQILVAEQLIMNMNYSKANESSGNAAAQSV